MEERQTDFVARCQASLESREVAVGLSAETTCTRVYIRARTSTGKGRPVAPSISSGSMNRMINVRVGIPPTFLLRAARKTYEPRSRTIN